MIRTPFVRSGCALAAAVLCLSMFTGQAIADTVVPYGVQNDVSWNTVLNDWGWTVAYRCDYSATVSIDDLFANATGNYVMLAAIKDGSTTFDVLAAAPIADVRTYTSLNQTHQVNGVEWYYNGYSMGFAGAGDTIYQSSADINGTTLTGPVNERDRLSWHTTGPAGYNGLPTTMFYGFRAGSNIGLNGDTTWDKVVLTANFNATAVPLPAAGSMVLAGMGILGGFGIIRRRLRKD